MPDFVREAQEHFAYSQSIRRDLHQHPELGFQEVRTAGVIARELGKLGIEVSTGIGKTGVVGLLEGEHPGPAVLLRFDIDALPILEETGAEYASLTPGKMHACGHDGHVAVGLTVAKLLNEHRGDLHGTIKLVFQPAEEGLGGAAKMIEDGVLENPVPVKALALHVWNDMPLGWIGVSSGPVMAGASTFTVRVTGKGGHGAQPQSSVDPVLAGAQIVTALQSIVSRNVSPLQAAVASVTQFHAGDAFNIIPQTAELNGTIRFFAPNVREKVFERFEQVVRGVGGAMGCQVSIDLREITPAVVNDFNVSIDVQKTARKLFPDAEIATSYQTMGSEDMAYMLQKIPGCYFFVGSSNAERGLNYGHHHPKFDIDEAVLPRAAALMAAAAYNLLLEA